MVSCVVVLWCKQKPFRGTTVIKFLGERRGGDYSCIPAEWEGLFLHTSAGHNCKGFFIQRVRGGTERKMWHVIKFKPLFLLVKICGINATMSPCSDLKPFPFGRNTRPQKIQVTAILDSLYVTPKWDKKRGGSNFPSYLCLQKCKLFVYD